MNQQDFDLQSELLEVKGDVKVLLERTKDLPDLQKRVAEHEGDLKVVRNIGYFSGLGVVAILGGWVKSKFGF